MISSLFEWMSLSLKSSLLIALTGAFTWGLMSILLSPCHLASIPLIIGFVDEQGRISTKRAFWLSFLFSLGILITIAVIGIITGLAGRMLGDVGIWGQYFVAIIFFAVGLYLLGVIPISFIGANQPAMKKKGMIAAFVLGLIFGIALGPCTFAFMAPVLGVTFSIAKDNFLYGVLILFIYGIGHCSVIVIAGTSTELVQKYLNWNEKSKGTIIIKKICGLLIIIAGGYLIINVR
ncbi:cytochrome c biogenesis CcdA family protein [bacterium]